MLRTHLDSRLRGNDGRARIRRFLVLTLSWLAFAALGGTGCIPAQEGIPDAINPSGDDQDNGSGKPAPAEKPSLAQVVPDRGVINNTTPVTLFGEDFAPGTEVIFGGFLALDVKVVDANTLTAIAPPQAAGKVDVIVRSPSGETATLSQAFEYCSAVSPCQGPVAGGTTVTILGKGFPESGMVILFGALAATDVKVLNSSVLTAVTPPQKAGPVSITLRYGRGADTILPFAYEYIGAVVADGGPRLVSAVSTGNTSVRVTFSEAVGEGAEDPSNYSIVQAKVYSESAALLVQRAVASLDRTVITLTTASQNEVTYELHVTGIKDLAGNPLAAPELLVDPTRTQFAGTPPTAAGGGGGGGASGIVDSDADGLPDNLEQYGWIVVVELVNKSTVSRTVTSDPYTADSDADGLSDAEEKAIGSDPRSKDTDGDMVPDAAEWNEWFSDPNDQDSDDDTFSDSLDIYFRTSPVIADTDGDQMSDAVEIIERNRNPLIADLPLPQITVDEFRLDLKINSTYTDEQGTTHSVVDATSSTFTQSRAEKTALSDTNSTESENSYSQKIGTEIGWGFDKGWGGKVTAEVGFGQRRMRGYSSTVNRENARASQQQYQQSVANALVNSERRVVTRTIEQALIQANVNLANRSDIAFTITNVEISVQQQDRRNSRLFRPIATLRPSGAADPTNQPKYNLGPFDPERGPIIFQNIEVFPNMIDDLMREPTGLIFQVVNFDILDEFGRNFVFSSQEVNDRTVGITIDFGDGIVESYRVATNSKFDSAGRALGIRMQRALEIAGIERTAGNDQPFTVSDPLPDGIRKTYGTIVDNAQIERLTRIRGVQNDLVGVPEAEKRFWAIITSNTDLAPDTSFSSIPIHAGDDFLLCFTRDVDKDKLYEREEYLYGSSDRDEDTDDDGLGDFFEVRTGWAVAKVPGLPYKTFPDPGRADSDEDGLRDDQELAFRTDPNRADTDEDALLDAEEATGTIEIVLFDGDTDDTNNKILVLTPYSSWAVIDGGNGTADSAVTAGTDDVQVVDVGQAVAPGDVVIAPGPNGVLDTTPAGDDIASLAEEMVNGPDAVCDTVATGDDVQVVPAGSAATPGQVLILAGVNGKIDTTPGGDDYVRVKHDGLFTTNPLNRDTDYDGIPDGREVLLGINPNAKDAGKVIDSDRDGLYDNEEDAGWDVTVFASDGTPTTTHVTSNKFRADTDLDGLSDVYEWAIQSNPRLSDSDGDTLFDRDEFDPDDTDKYYRATALMEAQNRCARSESCVAPTPPSPDKRLRTNVLKKDTDGDGRDDNVELGIPWTVTVVGKEPYSVYSKPWSADFDLDGLNDLQELKGGDGSAATPADATDANKADTDEDTINDNVEVARGSDPLAKDKYVRFTFIQIRCADADDEGLGSDCIEVYGTWYISKGGTRTTVVYLSDRGFCDGTVFGMNLWSPTSYIYDYVIREGEFVEIGTSNVYEHDDSSANDPFGDWLEQFSYMAVTSETITRRISGDDGDLDTTVRIEVMDSVPATRYPPHGP